VTDAARSAPLSPYNDQVLAFFSAPMHATELPANDGRHYEVLVSASALGPQVQLRAAVQGGNLLGLRFRVFGCPHLIAAAEACCAQFEGGPVNQLRDFSVSELMTTLGVPVEKTGRILLLEEDAIRALLTRLDEVTDD